MRRVSVLFVCGVEAALAVVVVLVAPMDAEGFVRDAGFLGAAELLPGFGPNSDSLLSFALRL
jgi:hypothetical protein